MASLPLGPHSDEGLRAASARPEMTDDKVYVFLLSLSLSVGTFSGGFRATVLISAWELPLVKIASDFSLSVDLRVLLTGNAGFRRGWALVLLYRLLLRHSYFGFFVETVCFFFPASFMCTVVA